MEQNKIDQQVQVAVPRLTQQDFIDRIIADMWQYTWAAGAIECINPDNVRLVYLRGYRFKGSAEGSWTAKVDGSHKIEVNKKEVNIADGTNYAGNIPQVDFDLLVINDNQQTPRWAKDFCKVGFCADNFQPDSYVSASGGIVEGDNLGSPHSAWMKNGNEIVDYYMYPAADALSKNTALAYIALNVMPAEVVQHSADILSRMEFHSRDVKVSSRNSVKEDPTPVLIPFYVLEYQFEGQVYYLAMMADSRGSFRALLPPVKDASKTSEQIAAEEMADKLKQAKMVKWGWLLAIVLLFVASFTVAVIYLIAWAIGYWFFKKPIKDRIKELDRQKADGQQKTKELLKKQLRR